MMQALTLNSFGIKKYLYYSKIAIMDLAAYPMRFFSYLYVDGVTLIVYFYLWKALFGTREIVNGFTLSGIVTYYAVIFTSRKLTQSRSMTRRMSISVQRGTLSMFLLQPIDFNVHYFFRLVTQRLFQAVAPISFVLLLTFYYGLLSPPQNTILFIISLFLSTLLSFVMYAIIGCMAFWTVHVWGIQSILGRIIRLLSGAVIPLSFYPQVVQNVNNFLPFQHLAYTPASIYIGNYDFNRSVDALMYQVMWILFLLIVHRFVWSKSLKHYDSVGN